MNNEHEDQVMETVVAEEPKRAGVGKMLVWGIVGAAALVLLVVVGIGYVMAKRGSNSPFALSVARALNLPVAEVNGEKISYIEYREDIKTLENFYTEVSADQPVPTQEQLSEQVLSRYMVNAIMGQVAGELNVSVHDEEIAAAKEKMISQFPSEDEAKKELHEKYGWSMDEYIEKVVQPILLEQAVAQAFRESDKEEFIKYNIGEEVRGSHILFQVEDEKVRKEVKKLAEEILKKIQAGESFAALAAQYGSDGTKNTGGDLGWFSAGAMVKPFEEAMFALKDGELSPKLVETEFGYHIIQRTGTRKAKDFNAFMKERIMSSKIVMYMNVPNPLETIFEDPTQVKN